MQFVIQEELVSKVRCGVSLTLAAAAPRLEHFSPIFDM